MKNRGIQASPAKSQRGRLKLITLVALLLVLVVLLTSGNQIVAALLNRHLPPLLTRELGLPVTIEPIDVQLLNLRAKTARLVMGQPDQPAIDARDVRLLLEWRALLRGRIQFRHVEASDLAVSVSRWPEGEDPLPEDYFFLTPWLPSTLELEGGRYLPASGKPWELKNLQVARNGVADMAFTWHETRPGGELDARLDLKSLEALLALDKLELALSVTGPDLQDSPVKAKIVVQPGGDPGYTLRATLEHPALNGVLTAGSGRNWAFPDQSSIEIEHVKPFAAEGLAQSLLQQGESGSFNNFLASPIPVFPLLRHTGSLRIGRIELGDELMLDTRADIAVDEGSFRLDNWKSKWPAGDFQGRLQLDRLEAGWSALIKSELTAREADVGLASRFIEADWLWSEGNIRLTGSGETWGGLLNTLQGELEISGYHRGIRNTPVRVTARISNHPQSLEVNSIQAWIGQSPIFGSLSLSGETRRQLKVNLRGQTVDLGTLFAEQDDKLEPGFAIPEYLGFFPEIDVNVDARIERLQLADVTLNQVVLDYARTPDSAQLLASASGTSEGKLTLTLDARKRAGTDIDDMKAHLELDKVDIQALLSDQQRYFKNYSSGTLDLSSSGRSVYELFESLRGNASLDIRIAPDQGIAAEIQLAGQARLVIENNHIRGVSVSNLDLDSVEQDVTGTLSMVAGRNPWIITDLEAERLDVDKIADWMPRSPDEADRSDLLDNLRQLGPIKMSLDAGTVRWLDVPLTQVKLEITSDRDIFDINRLDFQMEYGRFQSRLNFKWQNDLTNLAGSAEVHDVQMDTFLGQKQPEPERPMSGSLDFGSEGRSVRSLLRNLHGQARLRSAAMDVNGEQVHRSLDLGFKLLDNGVDVEVSSLQWDQSQLQGRVRYEDSTPPRFDIQVSGGKIDLLAWEQQASAEAETALDRPGDSDLISTARNSGSLVRRVLTTPLRLLGDPDEPRAGERFFNDQPFELDFLTRFDGSLDLKLEQITSQIAETSDLEIRAALSDGRLELDHFTGTANGGPMSIRGHYDWSSPTREASLVSTFENIQRNPADPKAPRSGFISVTSRGSSEAELAQNLEGQVFISLGRGPLDYGGLAFLTTDIASSMFGILIPGSERRVPELRCAVTLGQFKDGVALTPYGYVAQTGSANLVGRMAINLKEETLRLEFDSRSRRGVGISVGNVFSNAITVQGPITSPSVVPRTTSLLWRGWAAVMTGGLSIIGESLVKRVLAAENPCDDILKDIREKECGTESPVASSSMVCPGG